ncbi:MAG: hypothetical protein PHR81_02440 [Bacteroidales bacterium]|nr:hypothetical protein [Bacteroidales bacterium]MDD4213649.1 hypothetical protein [Bacteroidales bacterium]
MKSHIYLIIFLSCSMLISCTGQQKTKEQEEKPFEKGKIISKVNCHKNATHAYALYLPLNYSEEKKSPLIICFDPTANGLIPLELLKSCAEKYGYILAGSLVSRNGMTWETAAAHYDIMLEDIEARFSIDPGRIYTCGFSGGARVASSVAIIKGGIAGVIGCSGGFPQTKDAIKSKFDFFGFAGDQDMNYAEMLRLDMALEKNNFRRQFVVFEGTHGWPPKEEFNEVFLWMELNAMKDNKIPADTNFINQHFEEQKQLLENARKNGNKFKEYLLIKKMVSYFKGIADTKSMEEQHQVLAGNSVVKNYLQQEELNLKRELAMQQQYAQKLTTENATWWKAEVVKLNQFLTFSNQSNDKAIVKRILEYLSLAAFSASNSSISQNKTEEAHHYIELYSIIDTDNPEPEAMFARIFAQKKDDEKVLTHLRKAAKLGFSDKSRFENDTLFMRFFQDTAFINIMKLVENNKKLFLFQK